MIKINLLPVREERRALSARQQQLFFFLLLILVFIGIYYWNSSTNRKISNTRADLSRVDSEIARLSKVVKQVEKFKADKKVLQEKIRVIGQLRMNRQLQVHVMDELNKALPSQVWLLFIQERKDSLMIRGKSMTPDDIANFMRNLDKSEYFSDVELDVTTQRYMKLRGRKIRVNDFAIHCKIVNEQNRA